jgi:hypothetical protein
MPWIGEDILIGFGALAVVALTWFTVWVLLDYVARRQRASRW